MRVPIGRLKAHLSKYLDHARAGEAVVVTDRGRPVAQLVPLEGGVAQEGRVRDLLRAGLARRPVKTLGKDFLTTTRPRDPDGRSLEAVLEERAEGR